MKPATLEYGDVTSNDWKFGQMDLVNGWKRECEVCHVIWGFLFTHLVYRNLKPRDSRRLGFMNTASRYIF